MADQSRYDAFMSYSHAARTFGYLLMACHTPQLL